MSRKERVFSVLKSWQDPFASDGDNVKPLVFACYANALDVKKKDKLISINGTGLSGQPGTTNQNISLKGTLFRFASMTKVLAPIAYAMVCDMFPNEITLDTKASTFITELSSVNTYYAVEGGEVVVKTGQETSNLGELITLRNLFSGNSGLGYGFWGMGAISALLYSTDDATKIYKKFYADQAAHGADTIYQSFASDGNIESFTDNIIYRCTLPLLFKPNSYLSQGMGIYDVGTTVVAGCLNVFVKGKGYLSLVDFLQKNLFCKMNIKDMFFNCGTNPPTGLESNMADAYFYRSSENNFKKGSNISSNTFYSVYDKQSSGDGFVNQNINVYTKSKPLSDKYAGGFDWSMLSSLSSYMKIIKCLVSGGMHKGKRVLSKPVVSWVLATKHNVDYQITVCGPGSYNLLNGNQLWCDGFANKVTDDFPITNNVYSWGGYFSTSVIYDISTGNILISGSQISGASNTPTAVAGAQPPSGVLFNIITK